LFPATTRLSERFNRFEEMGECPLQSFSSRIDFRRSRLTKGSERAPEVGIPGWAGYIISQSAPVNWQCGAETDGYPEMRVILAQPRGFCAGVVRAIDIVEHALEKYGRPVYVRHEIVHNRHVVEALKRKGARFVEELDEVPQGAVTVFSAHGVPQAIVREAERRQLPVLDATCPLVSKVHAQGKRYVSKGRTLILIGHAGHPEVEGTMGQVGAPVHLVSSEADVQALDIADGVPIAYVTQTTLSIDDTRGVIAALKRRFKDIVGPDTSDICYATQNRQSAVRELCKIAEVILVVGAKNSSNSNRLREIGLEEGVPSYLIADGSELDPVWVAGKHTIGLTAGASAPEQLVRNVIEALRRLGDVEVSEMDGVEEKIEFRLPAELRNRARQVAVAE
jgi:4-hydroxy-3-methylbut-2-enyl diphosphate reductase